MDGFRLMLAIINNYQNHGLAQAVTASVLCSVAVSASKTLAGGARGIDYR